MKKTTSIIAALAVSTSLAVAPQVDARDMNYQPPRHTATGSAYTGSAPISLLLFALGVAGVAKLITDNVPPLREAVDQIAEQVGSSGSSGSSEAARQQPLSDFNLENLSSQLNLG
ncbi:hypothetical protein [Corynebacterium cystitidis]|uniref:Secreted protein n=1 Tax=Corynebacterium cystitidis DSM 20524 TaxID=1121357 RepID=A0A1H9UKK8_9CORY|nr:hypothetical protein [Corynebacterium cystitidis]WJY80996.1 hypothetical protein CCYS_00040 [Corynebacterium cystitidis DSM 20524]SES09714.1 hypothetical protein SAMN05661109_01837 [Corynebacterium cystitidis DSM 20524]SNV90813.1 Uncharacterised protein [Corynebacterium cystitidis]